MCRCQPKPAKPVVRYDTVLRTGTCRCLTGRQTFISAERWTGPSACWLFDDTKKNFSHWDLCWRSCWAFLFSLFRSNLLDALCFIFLISSRCCRAAASAVAVRWDFDYSGNPYRGRRLPFEIISRYCYCCCSTFNPLTSLTLQPSLGGVLLINC